MVAPCQPDDVASGFLGSATLAAPAAMTSSTALAGAARARALGSATLELQEQLLRQSAAASEYVAGATTCTSSSAVVSEYATGAAPHELEMEGRKEIGRASCRERVYCTV